MKGGVSVVRWWLGQYMEMPFITLWWTVLGLASVIGGAFVTITHGWRWDGFFAFCVPLWIMTIGNIVASVVVITASIGRR